MPSAIKPAAAEENEMSTLNLYESMSGLSAQMADAARANDWDRLSTLEHQVSDLREQMVHLDPQAPSASLSETERRRKIELIKRMLADDREVRRHTDPWMDGVRQLLGGNVRGRAMRNAYTAMID
jgi:flagellar protein FliT